MKFKTILPLCLLSLVGTLACSSGPKVDLGDGTNTTRLGERLSDYAAQWTGYAEAYTFADGSDLVRLSLDENGHGHLEFGSSPPLTPLDADTPDITGYDQLLGFAYPVAASIEDARLQLSTPQMEPFRAWCELQTPIESFDELNGTGTYYAAAPRGGLQPLGDGNCKFLTKWDVVESTPDIWNCNVVELSSLCACEASGCSLRDLEKIRVDAVLDNVETLTGTLLFNGSPERETRVTIRLTRTP